MNIERQHRIIRVGDGNNFRNSRYPFWGVKRGRNGCMKTIVAKMNRGDILWFMTSKPFGGKIIGMCEYTEFYDRMDEPLFEMNTRSNEDQNWVGGEDWDIQIHYCNLYITERQNITGCIACAGNILEYDTFRDKVDSNLYEHYQHFVFYAEPKVFADEL